MVIDSDTSEYFFYDSSFFTSLSPCPVLTSQTASQGTVSSSQCGPVSVLVTNPDGSECLLSIGQAINESGRYGPHRRKKLLPRPDLPVHLLSTTRFGINSNGGGFFIGAEQAEAFAPDRTSILFVSPVKWGVPIAHVRPGPHDPITDLDHDS